MKKYERMVAVRREESLEKVAAAKAAIMEMEEKEEKVTVAELMKRTGLSRAFFYKNETVRKALDAAMEKQHGMRYVSPRKVVLDAAMERQLAIQERKIAQLTQENAELKKENERLNKTVSKKTIAFLKKL